MNIQGWFPLGFTCLISLMSKWLSRVFCSSTIQKHHFFDIQPYGPALTWSVHELWKNYSFGYMGLCRQSVVQSLIHVRLFATPWTVAHQAPLSMEFSRQEYWSVLTQGSNLGLLHCRQILYRLSHQGSSSMLLKVIIQIFHYNTQSFFKLTPNQWSFTI